MNQEVVRGLSNDECCNKYLLTVFK